jgi:hypothetical protein
MCVTSAVHVGLKSAYRLAHLCPLEGKVTEHKNHVVSVFHVAQLQYLISFKCATGVQCSSWRGKNVICLSPYSDRPSLSS